MCVHLDMLVCVYCVRPKHGRIPCVDSVRQVNGLWLLVDSSWGFGVEGEVDDGLGLC